MGWNRLTDRLLQAGGEDVVLTFEQIERLLDRSLPPSAHRHAAFWSNSSSYAKAWLDAGYTVTRRGLLPEQIGFIRNHTVPVPEGQRPERPVAATAPPSGEITAVLVGCVKTKRTTPAPAMDLYTSPIFMRRRAYAERLGVPWYVVSAEHGLLRPDTVVAPYDRALATQSSDYRSAWGAWVAARLRLEIGRLAGAVVEVHAGDAYVRALAPALASSGICVNTPLADLRLGQQLAWYDRQLAVPRSHSEACIEPTDPEVDMLVSSLRDPSSRRRLPVVTPTDIPRQPGLYAWFVDRDGARELSIGLGLQVEEGLIYAGQAGATRWPSGKRSGNTLYSRVMDMHVRGSTTMSTFRRTLASVLQPSAGSAGVDESRVTQWMLAHLSVATVPVADADGLSRIEEQVLSRLDPPLNLSRMSGTPLRKRLKHKRGQAFGGSR
jgi:hypothetical protein